MPLKKVHFFRNILKGKALSFGCPPDKPVFIQMGSAHHLVKEWRAQFMTAWVDYGWEEYFSTENF